MDPVGGTYSASPNPGEGGDSPALGHLGLEFQPFGNRYVRPPPVNKFLDTPRRH